MAKGEAGKPKGRMTAYAYFVKSCREEHQKKYKDIPVAFAEFSKRCAERWKGMNDKEKKRFQTMAEEDKKRFDKEMKSYVPVKNGKKRKRSKDPNAPKRALSAFFWFCKDERPKARTANPDSSVSDIAKELGRRWALVSADEKKKYEAIASKDKARYQKESLAYKKKAKTTPAPAKGKKNVKEESSEEEEDDDEEEEEEDDDDDDE